MVTVVVGHGNKLQSIPHFNLIGHLGKCYKHTDETSGFMKISTCAKEGRPKCASLQREGGGREA